MMRSIRIFVFIWLSLVFILDVRAFFAFVKVKPPRTLADAVFALGMMTSRICVMLVAIIVLASALEEPVL